MNYIHILKMIVSLLPIVHTAIDQIEDLFPQGGYGAEKLAMLKSILESAINATDLGSGVFSKIWPLLVDIVAKIIAVKNSLKPKTVTVANVPAAIAR